MKIGVVLPAAQGEGVDGMPGWPHVRAFALGAEERGLDSVWMYDHFYYRNDAGELEGQHEAWTIVSAVAAVTERIEIGTIVLCTGFRNPGLTAKMAATLDEVSAGRFTLGLGAGWHDPEYDAFGYDKDRRADRFEEAVRIIAPLVRGERVTFEGRYERANEAELAPPPNRRIPILIACRRPRMLRLVASYADAYNTAWYGQPDERLRLQLAALDEAMQAEGRDPATMTTTVGVVARDPSRKPAGDDDGDDDREFAGSADELAKALDAHEALGVDHLIVVLAPMDEASLDWLTKAIELRSG
ncbi:MAG TPA: LLM class flavin-dependent oxidoreductase [Actinomycetota bacterium]|nr:LLM class flavin-dependent oxidoreductase [Actinomycetota bacterium]